MLWHHGREQSSGCSLFALWELCGSLTLQYTVYYFEVEVPVSGKSITTVFSYSLDYYGHSVYNIYIIIKIREEYYHANARNVIR